uniref:Suppressor of cytokine signaling 7 n=1 Tax=Cavia porcellus TaxID=10141 RepID=A0A286XG15_CAVPO
MVFRNVGRPPEDKDADAARGPGGPRNPDLEGGKLAGPGGLGQPGGPGEAKGGGAGGCLPPAPGQAALLPQGPPPPGRRPYKARGGTPTGDERTPLLVPEGLGSRKAREPGDQQLPRKKGAPAARAPGGRGRPGWVLQPPGPDLPPAPFPLQDFCPFRAGRAERSSSFKIRLSRLFRTKSCNGGSGGGDGTGKRPSGELAASAASLTDVGCSAGREVDVGRVLLEPPLLALCETVSLVDVDISQRGLSSPHPPTPPPPPRRSLSLLDDISGTLPTSVLVAPMGSSLQSFPLPPPPPPHAPDAFPRVVPTRAAESLHNQQPQHLQCALYRPDSSSFAASLRELEKCGWYWGPMNWEDAEMKLKGKPDGSFLVRDSSDPRYILSLSFRSQGITHHTRMEHYRGTFSLWCHPKFEDRCQSVVEFIKRAIMHSKNGKFLYFLRSRVPGLPPTPVQLLYPVSRFSNVKSLQHLCRFRIRQLVRIDHIPDLPLPKPLISYIRKFYYYDPQEEVYLSLKEAQLVSKQKQEAEPST